MDQRRLVLLGALLLSVLAASLHWYGESGSSTKSTHAKFKHFAPESIVQGFEQTTFSELGTRQYHMKATRLTHYANQAAAEMQQPIVTFFKQPAKSGTTSTEPKSLYLDVTDWIAKAKSGVINEDNDTLVLSGDVNVIKPIKNAEALTFYTESLLIKPNADLAKTDEAVTLKQAQHITKAKGLIIDIAAGKVELLSQVRSKYVPATL